MDANLAIREDLKSTYGDAYKEGESAWRRLCAKHKVDNIIRMCSSVPHQRVVDVGAGEGSVSAEMARRDFTSDITCLEVSESGVETIKQRELPKIREARQFDGYETGFSDKCFDLAISSHVLEHVEHERSFLYEIGRVAKYVFLEVPLEDTRRLPWNYKPNKVGHINFYNAKTFRRLVQSSGFEVLDQRLFNTPYDVLAFRGRVKGACIYSLRQLCDLISRRESAGFFTYHSAILCEFKSFKG